MQFLIACSNSSKNALAYCKWEKTDGEEGLEMGL